MSGHNFGNMRPIAQVGDLVRCLGYGNRVFIIDAYTHELSYDAENAFEDIYYDMTDALTKEYTLGGQEDIFVVCKEDKADDYLAQYLRNGKDAGMDYGPDELKADPIGRLSAWIKRSEEEEASGMSKESRLTPREESSQEATRRKQEREEMSEKADVLLDEIRDYMTLKMMFGDMDGEYQAKIDDVKAELAELMKSDLKEEAE